MQTYWAHGIQNNTFWNYLLLRKFLNFHFFLQVAVAKEESIGPLLDLLHSGPPNSQKYAVEALRNLSELAEVQVIPKFCI